jgi:hypothetical protein
VEWDVGGAAGEGGFIDKVTKGKIYQILYLSRRRSEKGA